MPLQLPTFGQRSDKHCDPDPRRAPKSKDNLESHTNSNDNVSQPIPHVELLVAGGLSLVIHWKVTVQSSGALHD